MLLQLLLLWSSVTSLRAVRFGEVADDFEEPEESSEDASTKAAMVERLLPVPDIDRALACLNQSSPNLKLKYPSDAEDHFAQINQSMKRWSAHHKMHCGAGYCGPWIENYWISHFSSLWEHRPAGARLHHIFGPYVPLLVPWTDTWVNNHYRYPEGMLEDLKKLLRPNVPYITVSQNDEGLPAKHTSITMSDFPNVLVLSAGGYGHVPVPLIKGEMQVADTPVQRRDLLVSYVGSKSHSPRHMRRTMIANLNTDATRVGLTNRTYIGHTSRWKSVVANSRFSLAPRGFGRTSYHFVEVLQMGLVPIQVYTDIPWVPYRDLFERIGKDHHFSFVTDIANINQLLARLSNVSIDNVVRMESHIRALRATHFMPTGVMEQITRFMVGHPLGDLRCQALPSTVRDADSEASP